MVKSRKSKNTPDTIEGRVIEMLGRKVRVETADESLVCHLAGNRVVIGDTVSLLRVNGGGGKITSAFSGMFSGGIPLSSTSTAEVVHLDCFKISLKCNAWTK